MIDFVWQVTFGQIISTTIISLIVLGIYLAMLFRLSRYANRVEKVELVVTQLQADVMSLTRALQMTDASAASRNEERNGPKIR